MSKATMAFGRFQPPTEAGHGKLVQAVQSHAENTRANHYIFPSHTQDKKKNPLTHDQKVSAMRSLFPSANIVSDKKVKTIIDAMKHLESKGHTEVTVIGGSDRVNEYSRLLNNYREKEFPKIQKVNVISAGDRDPDAEGAEGMSASKLRGLVAAGKKDEFISHYSNKNLGEKIHNQVKKGMQLESFAPVGIFLLGGPGSGKDYILSNIFSRFDLTEVQADHICNGSANELIHENVNIIINGVLDLNKIQEISNLLENYIIDHVYVYVTNKVSRDRNSMRNNPLNETKRIEKWLSAEKLAENFDCFRFNNSFNLNESSELEKVFFANQIEKLLERCINHGLEMKLTPEPKNFVHLREKKFPRVVKDKETGLPKKYIEGLSPSTAKARKAHWKKMAKLSDDNPNACKPAPGDATAKTKLSKYTKRYHELYNEEAEDKPLPKKIRRARRSGGITAITQSRRETGRENVSESKADKSLAAKSEKSGIPLRTLKTVFRRGVAAWKSGHRPGTTPQQWGHARVNSYITKGKTYHTADKDLREEINLDQLFEYQLVGTDEYRKHAIKMTPGQKEIEEQEADFQVDFTPQIKLLKFRRGMRTPGKMYSADLDGMPVTTAKLSEAIDYHLNNKIPFTENVFRPGSEMFFEIIKEAKRLYKEGKYEPKDEYEKDLLESDVGEFVAYEGTMIPLDFPFEEESLQEEDKTEGKGIGKPWREGGGGAVYVRDGDSIRKIRFSQSGMKKKFMDPAATRSFVARHRCLTNKDKTSASYWACRYPRFFSNSGKIWW